MANSIDLMAFAIDVALSTQRLAIDNCKPISRLHAPHGDLEKT
jgi:hypothetical protein